MYTWGIAALLNIDIILNICFPSYFSLYLHHLIPLSKACTWNENAAADALRNNNNTNFKAVCCSISGQQVRLLTKKEIVPEVRILNKGKGRISYENSYLVLVEHTTLTDYTFSLDELEPGSVLLH